MGLLYDYELSCGPSFQALVTFEHCHSKVGAGDSRWRLLSRPPAAAAPGPPAGPAAAAPVRPAPTPAQAAAQEEEEDVQLCFSVPSTQI